MDENSINVNCDFCGREIECPKDLLKKAKKHMCNKCYFQRLETGTFEPMKDVHVDLPREEFMAFLKSQKDQQNLYESG